MRLFILGPAFAAALMLSACATDTVATSQPAGAAAVPSGSTALSAAAQKALYAAESAYNVSANAYLAVADKLSPADKAKAKTAMQAAYQALLAGRRAATLADSAGVLSAVGAMRSQLDAAPGLVQQK